MTSTPVREIVFVHSSDLHLCGSYDGDTVGPADNLPVLREVLAVAAAVRADIVLLAGDTFEHNRQPPELLERAARTMNEFGAPIVILPGNHDPLTPDSIYRHPEFAASPNIFVLGLNGAEAVVFSGLDLEVVGKAHRDYADMPPLPDIRPRSTPWRITAAHGHYTEAPTEPGALYPSWMMRHEDLAAARAEYIALGHWNRAARVGGETVRAYYSGSPEYAGTVNVVRLRSELSVDVTRAPLGNDIAWAEIN